MDTKNYENIESAELQEMRQQMSELKAQLDKQLSINEESLRKNIMKKTSTIRSFGTWSLIGAIITAIFFPIVFNGGFGVSLACCLMTSIFCLCDGFNDFYSAHRINQAKISSQSVKENIETLISMKQWNKKSFIIGLVAIIIMAIWWAVELFGTTRFDITDNAEAIFYTKCIFIGILMVGVVVGSFVGYWLYRKQQRNIADMIDMIDNK